MEMEEITAQQYLHEKTMKVGVIQSTRFLSALDTMTKFVIVII